MSVGRQTLRLLPLTLLARGVGFVVPLALARWYGVDDHTDAVWYAFGAAGFLVVLGSVAVGTVLVPLFAGLRVRAPDRLPVVLGAALRWAVFGGVAVGVGARAVLPWALPHVSGFSPAIQARVVEEALALIPFLATLGPTAVLRAAAEALGRLPASALSPLLRALATLAVAGLLRDWGPHALPLAFLAGGLAEGAWLVAALARAGLRPARAVEAPELWRAATSALPVLVGEGLVAANGWVDRIYAGRLAGGAPTVLEYADRARVIPQALMEGTLLVAAYSAWARARATDDDLGRRRGLAQALQWVLLLAPPALGALWVLRLPVARLLYGGGAFDPDAVARTADALGAYVPAVFASLWGALVVRALVIDGRTLPVAALGALSFALNVGLNRLWLDRGVAGLAAATSATGLCVAAIATGLVRPLLRGAAPPGSWAAPAAALLAAVGLAAAWPPAEAWTLPPLLAFGALGAAGAWAARSRA